MPILTSTKAYADTRERPISFTESMVRAILEKRKFQTRRAVKPQPIDVVGEPGFSPVELNWRWDMETVRVCPYGLPGDLLWVRESWRTDPRYDGDPPSSLHENAPIWYAADDTWADYGRLRSKMFLPRKFSRLTLRVTDVRVQRVQEISAADAIAEGVHAQYAAQFVYHGHKPTDEAWIAAYAELWDSINAKREACAWADNPWVWAISFRRIE